MGKTRDFFKKIRDTEEAFHANMGTIKDRNGSQLKMCLVVKVKSDAVKNNIAKEPGMLGP